MDRKAFDEFMSTRGNHGEYCYADLETLWELLTPRWVPVEEGLPEVDDLVLALVVEPDLTHTSQVRFRRIAGFSPEYGEHGWRIGCGKVTHWMPIPPLPEDSGEEVK